MLRSKTIFHRFCLCYLFHALIFAFFVFADVPAAYSFCEGRNDRSKCHPQLVQEALPFLRPLVLHQIVNSVNGPDKVMKINYASDDHFDDCNFDGGIERINNRYKQTAIPVNGTNVTDGVIPLLSPYRRLLRTNRTSAIRADAPRVFDAMRQWAWILHAAQDFYAHSNWVELGFKDPVRNLIDNGWDTWREISSSWGKVRDDVIASQEPLPGKWKIDYLKLPDPTWPPNWVKDADTSELRREFEDLAAQPSLGERIPYITNDKGLRNRMLISGNSKSPVGNSCPVGVIISHEKLNKDNISRRWNDDAVKMAIGQTKHEWCRLVARSFKEGDGAVGLLMGLLVNEEGNPHPDGTFCSKATDGPIEVDVKVNQIRIFNDHEDDGPGQLNLVLSAFSRDLKRSARSQTSTIKLESGNQVPRALLPNRLKLCMKESEQLVVSLQGWEEDDRDVRDQRSGSNKLLSVLAGELMKGFKEYKAIASRDLSPDDDVLSGVTHTFLTARQLANSGQPKLIVKSSDNENTKDLEVTFEITAKRKDRCVL